MPNTATQRKGISAGSAAAGGFSPSKPKFEAYGEEMIEREVKPSGKSGRVYLPTEWVGKYVKIIRID